LIYNSIRQAAEHMITTQFTTEPLPPRKWSYQFKI